MTPIQCAIDLAEFLKSKFSDFTFSDKKMTDRKINIRSGFILAPTDNKEKEKQGGYIIVRPVEIDDGDDEDARSTVSMQILVATYNESVISGHVELYDVLQVIRHNLLACPIINKKFEVERNIKTHIPDTQPFPQWWGYIEITVKIPEIEREVNLNG